jgi:hypothetical protein
MTLQIELSVRRLGVAGKAQDTEMSNSRNFTQNNKYSKKENNQAHKYRPTYNEQTHTKPWGK